MHHPKSFISWSQVLPCLFSSLLLLLSILTSSAACQTEPPSSQSNAMPSDKDSTLSAQVVLRSASGASITSDSIITSENVSEFEPSQEDIEQAKAVFSRAGFEVGSVVGNNFSITAPADTFEKFFNTKILATEEGGIEALGEKGAASQELPLRALPSSLKLIVETVTFTPPPDFGPTEFFP